jgi:hypothetical protein
MRAETASPSISRTPWEIDAAGERRPSGYGSSFSVSSGRSRTMFSMPLAYPSTLDRRPLIAQMLQRSPSCVEGLWSPSSGAASGKAHAKANAYSRRAFPARNAEVFLSQAGPRFDLALVKLSITFDYDVVAGRLRTRKRRPVGSPSSGLLCVQI